MSLYPTVSLEVNRFFHLYFFIFTAIGYFVSHFFDFPMNLCLKVFAVVMVVTGLAKFLSFRWTDGSHLTAKVVLAVVSLLSLTEINDHLMEF